jgi:hypothetical protein
VAGRHDIQNGTSGILSRGNLVRRQVDEIAVTGGPPTRRHDGYHNDPDCFHHG